jgi:hypothetical protein
MSTRCATANRLATDRPAQSTLAHVVGLDLLLIFQSDQSGLSAASAEDGLAADV